MRNAFTIKHYFLIFSLTLFFAACTTKHLKTIVWEKGRDIVFQTEGVGVAGNFQQVVEIAGKPYFLSGDTRSRFSFYDFSTGVHYKTVTIKSAPKDGSGLVHLDYVAPDTIFAFFDPEVGRRTRSLDSLIVRVDTSGKILEAYSFATADSFLRSMPDYYMAVGDCYAQGKIYLPVKPYWDNLGDTALQKRPIALGGFIDVQKKGAAYVPDPVFHPAYAYHNYFPYDLTDSRVAIDFTDLNPIYSFGYSPLLYKYNRKTHKIEIKHNKSVFIDTIKPFLHKNKNEDMEIVNQFDIKQGFYVNALHPCPKQKYYLRQLRVTPDVSLGAEEANTNYFAVQILDSDLNLVAEALNPEGYEHTRFIFPSPEGLLVHNGEKGKDCIGKNCFVMTVYHPRVVTGDPRERLRALRQKPKEAKETTEKKEKIKKLNGWERYLQTFPQYNPKLKKQAIIFVPTIQSCAPCKRGIYHYADSIGQNYPLRVVVATYSPQNLQEEMKAYPVVKNSSVMWLDSIESYKKYVAYEGVNPRTLLFKDGRFIKELSMNPYEVPDALKAIEEHIFPKYKNK